VEIKQTTVDLDLFYEDDFKQVDETVRQRLSCKNDKGIVLLHGLPGTGKTTYLKYLITKIDKPVLFLPPHMAETLVDPGFADVIIRNPNTVLIIEDAENIIMDRKGAGNTAVATLLNLSDGLLSDGLNVQIICTFNSSLATIDKALLRKGRLIARYEFGKLSIAKAQRLSNEFGFTSQIDKPMSVAEIINQNEKSYSADDSGPIGFRKNSSKAES
jgi:ATP-dependent 26S proteasome regulatory subunit